jgi:hypothetical protein
MNSSPRMRLSARKGLALPMAIGSIVLIGMILAGVFFSVTQENRVGRNTITQERAFRASEFGLNNTYAKWNNSIMNKLATGGTTVTVDDSSQRGWIDSVRITRLNDNTYMLVSTGYAGSGLTQARHRISAAYRLNFPSINFLAALTAHGDLKLGGSSFIDGHDTPPAGWGCPPAGTEQPGVAVSDSNRVKLAGCTNLKCVDGDPDLKVTSAVNDTNTFFNYGDGLNWQSLTAGATLTMTSAQASSQIWPDSIGSVCNTANITNWGDPMRHTPAGACEGYFPIIYVSDSAGLTHITGGMGQGILLVEGDLLVDGGFQWYGPVIARGHISTQGTGGHFNGAVMAADVDLELNSGLGNALITYSSCAITQALAGSGVPRRLTQRSWAEMYYH